MAVYVDGGAVAQPCQAPGVVKAIAAWLGVAVQTIVVHLTRDLADHIWASLGEAAAWAVTVALLGLAGVVTTLAVNAWPGKAWKLSVAALCGLGPAAYSAGSWIMMRASGQYDPYMDFGPLLDALGSLFIGGVGALSAVGASALTLAILSAFERSR